MRAARTPSVRERSSLGFAQASVLRFLLAGLVTALPTPVWAQTETPLWATAPDTVVPEWGERFRELSRGRDRDRPASDDMTAWEQLQSAAAAQAAERGAELASRHGATIKERMIGGVSIIEITPSRVINARGMAVFLHGGAYVAGNGYSPSAFYFADASGLRTISVAYSLAPKAKWDVVTAEVVSVFRGLAEEGVAAEEVVLAGASAGGGLAAGSVLRMRDEGLPLPGALVLWSPWSDITETGDTYVTLAEAEPIYTYRDVLQPAADAYADRVDQRHPYVSPVYGSFEEEYPPTLIQCGTREIFLSNCVRLYRAVRDGGHPARLDIYEGMPHVFMALRPDASESVAAFKELREWNDLFLRPKVRVR